MEDHVCSSSRGLTEIILRVLIVVSKSIYICMMHPKLYTHIHLIVYAITLDGSVTTIIYFTDI